MVRGCRVPSSYEQPSQNFCHGKNIVFIGETGMTTTMTKPDSLDICTASAMPMQSMQEVPFRHPMM